ncbi:MAG: flippase-like domain-containing protein [Chitinivibrionales bacterium]|nr:flippase-like domain-containing protein [Chitinivibrionales bacterium]
MQRSVGQVCPIVSGALKPICSQAFIPGKNVRFSRPVQIAAGVAIAAAGLAIFLRDLDPGQLVRQMRETEPWSLAAVPVLTMLTLWLRAVRWGLILPNKPEAHKNDLTATTTIGFMVNNVVPARIGEAVRALLLWKRNRYGVTVSIGSLVVERALDSIVFMSFFALPVLVFDVAAVLRPYAWGMVGIIAAVLAFFGLYALIPHQAHRFAMAAVGLLPGKVGERAKTLAEEALSTLAWLRSWHRALRIFALSPVITGCYALMIFVLAPESSPLGLAPSLTASSFAALGTVIPLSPGYVGTLHATMLEGLVLLGQEREAARALTLMYHALTYLVPTLAGAYFLFRLDLDFKDIAKAREHLA